MTSENALLDGLAVRLGALSHPARLAILRHLSGSGCACCKDVVGQFDLAQSTVSQHLKVLVDAGLVRVRADRQRSLYEVDQRALAEIAAQLTQVAESCCTINPQPAGCTGTKAADRS